MLRRESVAGRALLLRLEACVLRTLGRLLLLWGILPSDIERLTLGASLTLSGPVLQILRWAVGLVLRSALTLLWLRRCREDPLGRREALWRATLLDCRLTLLIHKRRTVWILGKLRLSLKRIRISLEDSDSVGIVLGLLILLGLLLRGTLLIGLELLRILLRNLTSSKGLVKNLLALGIVLLREAWNRLLTRRKLLKRLGLRLVGVLLPSLVLGLRKTERKTRSGITERLSGKRVRLKRRSLAALTLCLELRVLLGWTLRGSIWIGLGRRELGIPLTRRTVRLEGSTLRRDGKRLLLGSLRVLLLLLRKSCLRSVGSITRRLTGRLLTLWVILLLLLGRLRVDVVLLL